MRIVLISNCAIAVCWISLFSVGLACCLHSNLKSSYGFYRAEAGRKPVPPGKSRRYRSCFVNDLSLKALQQ